MDILWVLTIIAVFYAKLHITILVMDHVLLVTMRLSISTVSHVPILLCVFHVFLTTFTSIVRLIVWHVLTLA